VTRRDGPARAVEKVENVMKKSLIALVIVALACPAAALAASEVTGFWAGTALNVDDNPDFDHEVQLHINCLGTGGTAKYTYINLDAVCESELELESIVGNVRTYTDTTTTFGCSDGKVTLTKFPLLGMRFQWLYEDGTVDTEGWLDKTGSPLCPGMP
jgi:hypothetical protein